MTRLNKRAYHKDGNRVPHIGVPDNFKPFMDKSINARIVVCPTCQAQVGEFCTSQNGKSVNHRARRRMALRKLRQMQDEALSTELPQEGGTT